MQSLNGLQWGFITWWEKFWVFFSTIWYESVSRQGLWILSCKEAIQLSLRNVCGSILRCLFMPEIMHWRAPELFLQCHQVTYLWHKTQLDKQTCKIPDYLFFLLFFRTVIFMVLWPLNKTCLNVLFFTQSWHKFTLKLDFQFNSWYISHILLY
jgi:hypothetical protein